MDEALTASLGNFSSAIAASASLAKSGQRSLRMGRCCSEDVVPVECSQEIREFEGVGFECRKRDFVSEDLGNIQRNVSRLYFISVCLSVCSGYI